MKRRNVNKEKRSLFEDHTRWSVSFPLRSRLRARMMKNTLYPQMSKNQHVFVSLSSSYVSVLMKTNVP